MIAVVAVTEEGPEQLLLERNVPLGPQLLDLLGGKQSRRAVRSVLTDGVPGCKVRAFFDDELDNEATVEVSVTLRYLAIHSASCGRRMGLMMEPR